MKKEPLLGTLLLPLPLPLPLLTHLAHEEGAALGYDGEVELVQVLAW